MKPTQLELNPVQSTDDFETDVANGYYRTNSGQDFHGDLVKFLIESGVPKEYASKAASYCYSKGHHAGHVNVLNVSYDVIDIFTK